MQQTILALGAMSSLLGLALMLRYGLTFHTRLQFGEALPQSFSASYETWRLHTRELRGRFGLVLAVVGAALATGATGLIQLPI